MTLKKRLLTIGILAVLCVGVYFVAVRGKGMEEEGTANFFTQKDVLHFWYTDETMTDYLNSAAVAYGDLDEEIRIETKLVSAMEYLEAINKESLNGEVPDLFLVTNESLEKAYLAGLASPIRDEGKVVNEENFPKSAINSVRYHDKIIGYPLSFETTALLYNRTLLEAIAAKSVENGEPVTVEELIPESIDDILTIADGHDAPENVESFFKWDAARVFYNYFFTGDAMILGGEAEDDSSQIDIYNLPTIQSLKVYQKLNQFFSIDTEVVNYDTVVEDFRNGKIVYTIAKPDVVATLEKAKENGEFAFEYGVTDVPDPSAELSGSALSVTTVVAVNSYSEFQDKANEFASYLVNGYSNSLYERTGKMAASRKITYEGNPGAEALQAFCTSYEHSVPIPKMMETSNFWVYLEIALRNIWSGEDVNTQLKELSEKVMMQVTGEDYTEEWIEVPVEETEEVPDEGLE